MDSGCAHPAITTKRATAPQFQIDSVVGPPPSTLGGLVGTVIDSASGGAIAGAVVLLNSDLGVQRYYAIVDRTGGFLVARVAPGRYRNDSGRRLQNTQ